MFPFLSDLINYLFGISFSFPLPMFGFMVALAFIAANLLFVREMKRKENEGLLSYSIIKVIKGEKASINELIGNGIFGFVVGYKIGGIAFNYAEVIADLPDFVLSLKGNFIAGIVGAIALAYLKYRDAEKQRLPEPKEVEEKMHPYQHVGNMTFIAAVGGILGAKLFDAVEDLERFAADPIGVLFSGSGLSIYGGLIIGGGAVIYYAHKKGLKLVHVIDACAPGLILAYGIGRIGCQLAGDGDWGTINELPIPEAGFVPSAIKLLSKMISDCPSHGTPFIPSIVSTLILLSLPLLASPRVGVLGRDLMFSISPFLFHWRRYFDVSILSKWVGLFSGLSGCISLITFAA